MKRLILAVLMLFMLSGTAHAADCAVTVTVMHRDVWGGTQVSFGYITVSAGTYPSEGMSLTAGQFGMGSLQSISFTSRSGVAYNPYYAASSSVLVLTGVQTNSTTVTENPVTTDSDRFIVTDDNSAASNGKPLCVVPNGGGTDAYLASLETHGMTTSAHLGYYKLTAADSATTITVLDTVSSCLGLLGAIAFGDTIFFDDDGTDHENRLYYTGTGLGNRGTLYVEYSNGRMIKIQKSTCAGLWGNGGLAATALFYDKDGTALDEKVLSVCNGNASSSFGADITYSSMAVYNTELSGIPDNKTLTTQTYYFTAVGF